MKFHDGTDVDAAAIKYNYDRWIAFPGAPDYSYYAGAVFGGYGDGSNIAATDAPDASTFTITLKSPVSSLPAQPDPDAVHHQQPHGAEGRQGRQPVTDVTQIPYAQGGDGSMVGTGPYKFKSWTIGDNVTSRRTRTTGTPMRRATSTRSCSSRSRKRPSASTASAPVRSTSRRRSPRSTSDVKERRPPGHRPRRVVQPVPPRPQPDLQARTRRSARRSRTRSTSRR